MRMGVWSMARVLRQLIEYYYYYCKNSQEIDDGSEASLSEIADVREPSEFSCITTTQS